jgi:hypothetical protein
MESREGGNIEPLDTQDPGKGDQRSHEKANRG